MRKTFVGQRIDVPETTNIRLHVVWSLVLISPRKETRPRSDDARSFRNQLRIYFFSLIRTSFFLFHSSLDTSIGKRACGYFGNWDIRPEDHETITSLRRRTDVPSNEREKMNGWKPVKRPHKSRASSLLQSNELKVSIKSTILKITLASIFHGASSLQPRQSYDARAHNARGWRNESAVHRSSTPPISLELARDGFVELERYQQLAVNKAR